MLCFYRPHRAFIFVAGDYGILFGQFLNSVFKLATENGLSLACFDFMDAEIAHVQN